MYSAYNWKEQIEKGTAILFIASAWIVYPSIHPSIAPSICIRRTDLIW